VLDVAGTVTTSSTMLAESVPWEIGYQTSEVNGMARSLLMFPAG